MTAPIAPIGTSQVLTPADVSLAVGNLYGFAPPAVVTSAPPVNDAASSTDAVTPVTGVARISPTADPMLGNIVDSYA
jgi:hypothetical protein